MSNSQALRIAVEGCGHGTLDAIYASVRKSCEIKGWDGVDLVIICGDFQAVRNHQDLNMTAMPAHYRKMGDFHHYYYGTKVAPYLTVFIGGNHEASNYLFELHYGGWAAPNIYYLGAANVIRIGPLKIASTSGVYKRYDYQKPHFERLPYNNSDMRSVYHQRELDIRKLLSYRSQVDIGLSHDWPCGIEWLGNHQTLFTKKPHFLGDAKAGIFGSKPSAMVLDRLRPPYWFSAHHHYRYTAYKSHDDAQEQPQGFPLIEEKEKDSLVSAKQPTDNVTRGLTDATNKDSECQGLSSTSDTKALTAWNSFKDNVQEQDAVDNARDEEALQARLDERSRTGQHAAAVYTFEEDYKKVSVANSHGGLLRQAQSHDKIPVQQIPQLDGTCCSLPKRRRNTSPSDEVQQDLRSRIGGQLNGLTSDAVVANPDAIDLDLSDSDDDDDQRPLLTRQPLANEAALPDASANDDSASTAILGSASGSNHLTHNDGSDDAVSNYKGGANKNEAPQNAGTNGKASTSKNQLNNNDDSITNTNSEHEGRSMTSANPVSDRNTTESESEAARTFAGEQVKEVPEHIRAELAKMSSTFAPEEKVDRSPDLPFPADITNKATRFLALSKVEKGRANDFLQLLEVEAYNTGEPAGGDTPSRPYVLQYDPEWLAITRVFASELRLGGSSNDKIPSNRGQTYYRAEIVKEEGWVQENVVDKDLLTIPEDFEIQTEAQDFEHLSKEDKELMPRELTNPQTSKFCELVGITNPFDISEEERDARMIQGPIQDNWQQSRGNRGRPRGGERSKGRGGGRGRGSGRRGRGGGFS